MSNHVGIVNNIVCIRTRLGITQEELALRADISVSRLRDIEHNTANYTIDTLCRISSALGVTVWSVFILQLSDEDIFEDLRTARERLGLIFTESAM